MQKSSNKSRALCLLAIWTLITTILSIACTVLALLTHGAPFIVLFITLTLIMGYYTIKTFKSLLTKKYRKSTVFIITYEVLSFLAYLIVPELLIVMIIVRENVLCFPPLLLYVFLFEVFILPEYEQILKRIISNEDRNEEDHQ